MTRNGALTETYDYDPVGNRLSSLGVASYTSDASNHLNSTSSLSFTYDLNGNTLTKTDAALQNTTGYSWDFENRLTSVTLPGNGGAVTFKYDPFGRRIQKAGASGIVNYVYDGANIAAEYDSLGNVVARYVQGAGIDEPLALQRGATMAYYNADGLGSITALTGRDGSAIAAYTYDAFGKNVTSVGDVANSFRYTGRELDVDTGLYYYRARYYDATIGRFITEDPIRFASGTVNFYGYVDNDPVNLEDPSGLRAQVCCRPLRGKLGHLSGRNHCYVLITSEDDQLHWHTYGLHRENANNVKFPGGAKPLMDDPTDVGGTCADVPDATPCKERQFAQQSMSNTNCPSCGSNYWVFSTNSNYWVWDALRNAGMTPPKFRGGDRSPGYGPVGPRLDMGGFVSSTY